MANVRRETLSLRIKSEDRNLIDRAASVRGKNRSEFILEAAHSAAEEALLDQTLIALSSRAYSEFVKRLDAAPRPNERLRKTMQMKPPWKEK